MKKIAVFVEGQSELIFFRNLLLNVYSDQSFSFDCFDLHANALIPTSYSFKPPDTHFYFLIINVGNDNRVISFIKQRYENLLQNGFSEILGLRDMYSKAYRESSSSIDQNLNQKFLSNSKDFISSFDSHNCVSFFFSIMEVEAWWLGMDALWERFEPTLTCEKIFNEIGYKLDELDPESAFFHPATILNKIHEIVGKSYDKKFSEIEAITTNIKFADLQRISDRGICRSFKEFIDKLDDLFLNC